MFERFTDEAKQAVVSAQQQARDLRADRIEPVHLLLALAAVPGPGREAIEAAGLDHHRLRTAAERSGTALDADALAALGIDLDQVRAATEATFGPGALDGGAAPRGHLRFTAGSKKALELSLRLAMRRPGRRVIDSGCLLHGVLSLADPVVVRVLHQLDGDPDVLRARIEPDVA
ncbi:hypothetical protein GB931_05800 [Modestobacter sp. I12A-02628]|uniref:Clp R domain-containing protein n=1 Tax=Goekera deserti TaxID=2497753 RepID=A0A7K3WB62_9ACTN|nr:Clp protease N-terminal domain-containing protein [Goekera deserti]MPQ97446.1 hypothetical protein [Goekera deserti]NDI47953.1 hypothetical protein [Goekera deserti]NEL53701.1 hypothetical protein [Goekera deserti]